MKPVTLERFTQICTAVSPTLFLEPLQQTQVPPFLQSRVQAWEAGDFVMLRTPRFWMGTFDGDSYYICAVTKPAGYAALPDLLAEVSPLLRENDGLHLCLPDPIPDAWSGTEGARLYETVGVAGESDAHVLPLTDGDVLATLTDCAKDDPSDFRDIAETLAIDMRFSKEDENTAYRFLGYFENGMLLGAVSLLYESGVAVNNLYVRPDNRGRGIATALLKSALILYPGTRYTYSHWIPNVHSGKTALAAGFVPVGSVVRWK